MSVTVSGMQSFANNGTFPIIAVGSGTFTVTNPVGATAGGRTGSGIALTPQIPVLVLTNP